ncbi:MAG: carboxypeptidase regulatory-like domain-containing protein [Lunatimonas sp.]|uniref:carboxypeptidase regulatory-like domain-containing protein n=1 Tax=Lunatimonas sp. TaxID=2060141 RepID=UPI00263B4C87|nr:carboxypeptidase regulatory-like domain-containing protein [Lunatimonas sp.]MCC5936298.1 carboxypeptidase regulatory-like domain-containing protein [Lunatimonas sp.]
MKMPQIWLGVVLLLVVASCKPIKPITQGLRGQVFWVEGNLMPQVSEDGSAAPGEAQAKRGAKRILRIHALTTLDQVSLGDFLIGSIQTEQVAEVETESDGSFHIELPAGRYSVFTVEEEGYFANIFDQQNHINPVEVNVGEWSFLEIVINYRAVY